MRYTTIITGYVMRFPRMQVDSERNDKVSFKGACGVNKQVVVQKFQDDIPPFRIWIDFLLHNGWRARFRSVKPGRPLKYLTITIITRGLEYKVVSTETSIFPEIFKGGGKV